MLRDAQAAMRAALAHGPGHCPPDLFAGPVDRILLGLKAHANTIAHARHVALEETFPRTRALLGAERFHALADTYLERGPTVAAPLADIGIGFPALLAGPARDLARLEWAWLLAHGAADAPAFDLAAVAQRRADAVASALVARHPAACTLRLRHPGLAFDGVTLDSARVLVTRPALVVAVTAVSRAASRLLASLDQPVALGDLLETDAPGATELVTHGALALAA